MARTVDTLPPAWDAVHLARVLREHMPAFRAAYGVDTLQLFGSYARNEQRADSDLDLLVSFVRTPTLFDVVRLRSEVSALLGVPVDLTLRSTLRPGIARNISQDLLQV